MNIYASHDIADNGAVVQSSVLLEWDDDKPFDVRPFWTRTSVNHILMSSGFYATASEAKRDAEKMTAAYLEVHSADAPNAELTAQALAGR